MKILNGDLLVKHLNERIAKYKKRQETAKNEGHMQEATDYDIRILPCNNLLIRIMRGEFDHRSIKKEPEAEPELNKKGDESKDEN